MADLQHTPTTPEIPRSLDLRIANAGDEIEGATNRPAKPRLDLDPVDCPLARATAVLDLIVLAGESADGFSLPHNTIIDAVATVGHLVDEARAALESIEPEPAPTDVDLDADTLAKLDAYAERHGITREEAITQLIESHLAEMVGVSV